MLLVPADDGDKSKICPTEDGDVGGDRDENIMISEKRC
jgi:hypothetical protein